MDEDATRYGSRAIGSVSGGPSAAVERLLVAVVGAPELRLPLPGPSPTVLRPTPNTLSVFGVALLSYAVFVVPMVYCNLQIN